MQTTTETTEGHEGTGMGVNRDAALDPRAVLNPLARYMRAKAALSTAEADMAESWVDMTRDERMRATSPSWSGRDTV